MRLSAPIHQLKRRAKRLARDKGIALHQALDATAREEGFGRWSLLSAWLGANSPSRTVLPRLSEGDLLLLGAQPGHGKTLLGLQLLLDAVHEGRRAVFFTLEYTELEAWERFRSLDADVDALGDRLEVVTSDDISADYMIRHLSGSAGRTVAVIDYLQLLDQQRSKPPLLDQLRDLRDFAQRTGAVLGFIAQIDRRFDPKAKPLPEIRDIRLPNPVDLGLFSKACFLHNGEVRLQDMT